MSKAAQNTLQPPVKLTIGDGPTADTYLLRFDFEAVAEVEEIVDMALITGLRAKDITAPKARLVQAMLFASAHADQPSLTWDQARKLVTKKNLPSVWSKVLEAWAMSNPEPEDQPAADPTQAQS